MQTEVFDADNTLCQLMMVLKMQKLQREALPSLSYENLEDYLKESLWKNGCPKSLHQAADDILSVTADDLVRFLSRKALVDGKKSSLEEYSDVIGGN